MPDQFAPKHFHEVAEFLLEESGEETSEPDRWRAIEDARTRSSISRSYYAVFLVFKEILEGSSRGWKMPWVNAHVTLREALEGVLGDQHVLVVRLRNLWRDRKKSDYELGPGHHPSAGMDACEWCEDAVEAAHDLTKDEIREIVSEINLRKVR